MTDFDFLHNRKETGSVKWDYYASRDIIPLWVADADFQSPPCILDALRKTIDFGIFGYSNASKSCSEAFINYTQSRHQLKIEPNEIFWLPGLVCALNAVCRAFAGPSDEILSFSPIYPPFLTSPANSDQISVPVPMDYDGSTWSLNLGTLRQAITPRSKVLLLCNPYNPLGKVFTKEELLEIADICLEHKIIICSDEVHCDLILNPAKKHIPIASLSSEIAQNTITLMAPSKTWNIAGLGCSVAHIPNITLRRRFIKTCNHVVPDPNLLGLIAVEAAYTDGEAWRLELIDYLRANYKLIETFLKKELPQLTLSPLDATYLAWIDFSKSGLTNPPRQLEAAGIGLSSGKPFGRADFMRLNFACPRPLLEKALERLKNCLLNT
jgi:cysteine-S-conjugate beta-lyase